MQRVYELMVVIRPDFGPPRLGEAGLEEKEVRDLIEKLIGDRKMKDLTIMGKKRLAYPIKKRTEGVYAVATVAGSPLKVVELEKQMKMGSDVLRYLLIAK